MKDVYDEEDLYNQGHANGWDECKKMILKLLNTYKNNEYVEIREIKDKIKNKNFEFGEF